MDRNKINRILFKISNYAGPLLGIIMLIYIISGYGITKGIMSPLLAKSLHSRLLPIPLFMVIGLHAFIKMNFNLRKRVSKDIIADIWTIILFGLFMLAGLYLYFL
ncbi:hypothetical protein ISS06_00360 [Patescibacteria group bacterium]|nr:hypothetical protein [Patescibacteria group bacterium]